MLVLTRKVGESIIINGNIKVTVTKVDGGKVRLGIEAPPDVKVLRSELIRDEFPTALDYQEAEAAFAVAGH
jgi:carbon storage regulator